MKNIGFNHMVNRGVEQRKIYMDIVQKTGQFMWVMSSKEDIFGEFN